MTDNDKPIKFSQRVDFYGKALAIYIIILAIFFIFNGSVNDGNITIRLFSPIIILMLSIIIITAVMLIVATIKRKHIIFSGDNITFQTRYYSKTYPIYGIKRIKISTSPTKFVKNNAYFVKIKLKNKKKPILVRTASFNKDNQLLEIFVNIRKQLK